MLFEAFRDFLFRRRAGRDIVTMLNLTKVFFDQIQDLSEKNGCRDEIDAIEVLALGTYLTSEIYLVLSRNRSLAGDVLDEFHRLAAEWLFNRNLPSLQRRFPGESIDAMYEQAITLFFQTTQERYGSYRAIVLDETGRARFSPKHFSELTQHLLKSSASIEAQHREQALFSFGVAGLEHMSRSMDALKH